MKIIEFNLITLTIICLIAMVIGFVLGFICSNLKSKRKNNEIKDITASDSLEYDDMELSNELRIQSITMPENREIHSLEFNKIIAEKIMGEVVNKDDLKIIVGIGSSIESLLQNNGINTWKKLAESNTDELKNMLNKGGNKFYMHNPSSWSYQALLAYQNNWSKLLIFRKTHKTQRF